MVGSTGTAGTKGSSGTGYANTSIEFRILGSDFVDGKIGSEKISEKVDSVIEGLYSSMAPSSQSPQTKTYRVVKYVDGDGNFESSIQQLVDSEFSGISSATVARRTATVNGDIQNTITVTLQI